MAEIKAKLVTKAEAKAKFLCEGCGITAPGPWPKGWVEGGRSRRRVCSDARSATIHAQWCPSCQVERRNSPYRRVNPTEGEVAKLRVAAEASHV